MRKLRVAFSIILVILILGATLSNLVGANPIATPDIWIMSPQNRGVYRSDTVHLYFYPTVHLNLSYSYSLDGQSKISTIQNSNISGLSAGSHNLKVYGFDSSGKTYTSWTTHFAIFYATAWILPAIILIGIVLAIICLVLLIVFKTHLLSGKKTGRFWFGVVWLGFSSFLTLVFVWREIDVELYFQYAEMRAPVLSAFVLAFCLFIGVLLMLTGLQKSKFTYEQH